MSSHPRPPLARLATDLLAAEELDVEAASSPLDDERAVAAIGETIRRARRARRARRVAVGLLLVSAAAASAAAMVVIGRRAHATPTSTGRGIIDARLRPLAEGVVVLREGSPIPIEGGGALLRDADRILTTAESARAAIGLSTGSHLVVEGGSEVSIIDRSTHLLAFALEAGALHADVAKLGASDRFIVRTRDAEIEVRGTSFRVAIRPSDEGCIPKSTTRVSVDEGVVTVRFAARRDETFVVNAHDTWPKCITTNDPSSATPAIQIETTPPRAPPPFVTGSPATSRTSPPKASASLPTASELAAQNALYGEATAARRRGDTQAAITGLERLATLYPSGPLTETALVERMRLLANSDHARGAEAARQYLHSYPRGFAREEAARVAAASTP